MRRLIGGNWKMNCTRAAIKNLALSIPDSADVFIAVPFVYFSDFHSHVTSNLKLAAQTVSSFDKGPYTGDVSADMLLEYCVEYAIVGHSERRIHCHETNKDVNMKLRNLIGKNIVPVLCIGEPEHSRIAGTHLEFLKDQFFASIQDLDGSKIEVAYEPVWAIGSGAAASKAQLQDVLVNIKEWMRERDIIGRVIYGGSVDDQNVDTLIEISELDGFLVGNASLDDRFERILQKIASCSKNT